MKSHSTCSTSTIPNIPFKDKELPEIAVLVLNCTQLDGFIRTANGFARAGNISTQQANQIIQTLPYSAQAIKTSLGCA
ncbi:MAG: hypothetical protein WBP64_20745 [Nitrososphaeraceae archaeon]